MVVFFDDGDQQIIQNTFFPNLEAECRVDFNFLNCSNEYGLLHYG